MKTFFLYSTIAVLFILPLAFLHADEEITQNERTDEETSLAQVEAVESPEMQMGEDEEGMIYLSVNCVDPEKEQQ